MTFLIVVSFPFAFIALFDYGAVPKKQAFAYLKIVAQEFVPYPYAVNIKECVQATCTRFPDMITPQPCNVNDLIQDDSALVDEFKRAAATKNDSSCIIN